MPLVGDHGGQKKPNQIRLSFLEEFFLSGTAAVAAKTVACPLESYKPGCAQIQPEADRMGLVLQVNRTCPVVICGASSASTTSPRSLQ